MNNKKEVLKAFELFNKKSTDSKVNSIVEVMKDASITQANLENIYLDVSLLC